MNCKKERFYLFNPRSGYYKYCRFLSKVLKVLTKHNPISIDIVSKTNDQKFTTTMIQNLQQYLVPNFYQHWFHIL
jgi:hypothetical protein